MLIRTMTIGVAMLVLAAAPMSAQERGTIEFGSMGNWTFYDSSIAIYDGWGLAGRVGAFIFPNLSVEVDVGRRWASLPGQLGAEVEAFAARVVAVPLRQGPVSLLAGAGIVHTDYAVGISDGLQGLLGAKLDLGRNVALRVDGLMDFNGDATRNTALQAGVSMYRHPAQIRNPAAPFAVAPVRRDSVSGAETARLRAAEREYRTLRASLARAEYVPESSAAALATMAEVIHFAHNDSMLSTAAMTILDRKVTVFRENPAMRIVITGFTSSPGTAAYNMALGLRRAESTKAYLVASGVDPVRIEIATRGQGELVVDGPGERAAAANRRGEFRLLVADPYLRSPGR
jgi:peptidoglycan-associated lipoprotein